MQRRASLSQESAVAQALQGKEVLPSNIIEEMVHMMQVSVPSPLHLRQTEEIKVQCQVIK